MGREGGSAYLWTAASGTTTLPVSGSHLRDVIGDSGDVAGQTGGNAVLYRDGVLKQLNQLVSMPSGVTLNEVVDINARGQILATSVVARTSSWRVWLLTPR